MYLSVQNGPHAGTSVLLERDRRVSLGSAEDNDLRLRDPGVPAHAAVVKALKGEGFGIKALAGGLYLNGSEIEAARLQEGDVLELGGTRVVVNADQPQDNGKSRLGGFRLMEEIGRGGMGIVYRAEQISLHREVALKVLSQELTEDPVFVARFVAEARAAARLHHPNVVQVYDVDHDGDTYYYSMELMHEGSLEAWLRKHGKMPVDQAVQVIADAAQGLSYAESLRIVHRDIKPDNLMLDRHGTVKIADLGLALTEEDTSGKVHGTPHFMAPEQALRRPVDPRTDLYALGCTFYRLVTGRTPFRGATVKDILRAHVKEEPEPPHKVEQGIPIEVSAIITRLMEKDPEDRYQSAGELLEELQTLLAPPTRKGVVIASVAGALLVAGAALTYAVTREDKEPTVIEKYRDNPEAQRLARENEELKGEVALLRAQIQGGEGEELAEVLERVAAEHSGTPAAARAASLAEGIRQRLAAARAQAQARARALREAVAALEQNARQAIHAGEYERALEILDAGQVDASIAGEPQIEEAREALRRELMEHAERRLAALQKPLLQAREDRDPDGMSSALDRIAAVLEGEEAWPPEVLPARDELLTSVQEGRSEVTTLRQELRQQRLARTWRQYEELLQTELLPRIDKLDFAGAMAAARAFAGELDAEPAAQRCTLLTRSLELAEGFAAHLEQKAASGGLQLRMEDGEVVPVVRLQRGGDEAGIVVLTGSGRSAKETLVPLDDVGELQWQELSELAAEGGADLAAGRDSYLGYLALAEHARAARAYLRKLQPEQDDSGTGEGGYPLTSAVFDRILRRLPGGEAWAQGLGRELEAARALAGGLRALSERRNLAAASHLDALLADHPHSLVVLALR